MDEFTTVYQYFAANGALIYVGITNRGTRRLHEHADSKPWWQLATGCTLEHFLTREEALAREESLIKRYRPPYNIQHNPERNVDIAQRSARLRVGAQSSVRGMSLKERRAEWYAAPKSRRAVLPCVECGERPGITGPSCINCRQRRASAPGIKPIDIALDPEASMKRLLDAQASGTLRASEQRLLKRLQQTARDTVRRS